jgi:hypothetical protein
MSFTKTRKQIAAQSALPQSVVDGLIRELGFTGHQFSGSQLEQIEEAIANASAKSSGQAFVSSDTGGGALVGTLSGLQGVMHQDVEALSTVLRDGIESGSDVCAQMIIATPGLMGERTAQKVAEHIKQNPGGWALTGAMFQIGSSSSWGEYQAAAISFPEANEPVAIAAAVIEVEPEGSDDI